MLRWLRQQGCHAIILALALVVFRPQPCAAETDADMAHRYLRAAERNDVTAQAYVGALYSAGIGLTQSDRDAFRWFLRAAEQGHSQAQIIVAEMYAIGKGVAKSNTNAYHWATRASQIGDSNVRSSAKQLLDILASRMSASERTEATRPTEPGSRLATPPVTTGDALSYYRRGRVRAQRGEYALAAEDFNRVTQLLPNNADALNDLCWTRAVLGQLQAAISACNQSLRIRPNFADALDSRGLAYLKLGEFDRAIDDFNAALRLKPDHATSLYGRGIARLRSGMTSRGNDDIRTARGLDPNIVEKFSRYGVQ
jgi:tetratricopeptide (TPR) repeat protein